MKKLLGGIFPCLAAAFTLAADLPGLAPSNNGFAFALFSQVLQREAKQNVFMSPLSVSIALQMLCNGAGGKTRAEIQGVLNTKDLPQDELNGFYKDLNGSLTSQTNVVLNLANSIWTSKGSELRPSFVSTNLAFFSAAVASVNFETPESADTINRWASDSTRGRINGVVSFPFPANTEVILANAIYFKGQWATPFDKHLTQKRYFYLDGTMIKQTLMMSRRGTFQYEENDAFQAVELPYAGDRLQMILFLPGTNSSPAKLVAAFNGTNWTDKILARFSSQEGVVVFPKFQMNSLLLLKHPLQRLGMADAFIPGTANFSGMSADPLFVSQVVQKSYVEVNEQGTEAAAVTTIHMRASAVMRPPKPFEMIVDHPFFFVIFDKPSGTILFMGTINDPTDGAS